MADDGDRFVAEFHLPMDLAPGTWPTECGFGAVIPNGARNSIFPTDSDAHGEGDGGHAHGEVNDGR